jgi:hypothetical protein
VVVSVGRCAEYELILLVFPAVVIEVLIQESVNSLVRLGGNWFWG